MLTARATKRSSAIKTNALYSKTINGLFKNEFADYTSRAHYNLDILQFFLHFEDCCFIACDAVKSSGKLPTFWSDVLRPSSGCKAQDLETSTEGPSDKYPPHMAVIFQNTFSQ
jgi:hypothetical protein